jgi:hypothetical protein
MVWVVRSECAQWESQLFSAVRCEIMKLDASRPRIALELPRMPNEEAIISGFASGLHCNGLPCSTPHHPSSQKHHSGSLTQIEEWGSLPRRPKYLGLDQEGDRSDDHVTDNGWQSGKEYEAHGR